MSLWENCGSSAGLLRFLLKLSGIGNAADGFSPEWRMHSTQTHMQTHTRGGERERESYTNKCKSAFSWNKTPALSVQISVRDRLGNCSLLTEQHDWSYKFKTTLVHTAAVSSVLDIYLHNIKCCGFLFSFIFLFFLNSVCKPNSVEP